MELKLMLRIKRAYEKSSDDDGARIFVDRLWPRGLTRERLAVNEWLKELSPSDELRKCFSHEPEKFPEFREKYVKELSVSEKTAMLKRLSEIACEKMLLWCSEQGKQNTITQRLLRS
jgi:uncharacterized protein YeaO (DUF488 family)